MNNLCVRSFCMDRHVCDNFVLRLRLTASFLSEAKAWATGIHI